MGALPRHLQDTPGPHLIPAGLGLFRLSASATARLAPIFAQLGYDVARVRVSFGWVAGSEAGTEGDHVTIRSPFWRRISSLKQLQLVAHEATHSAQFVRLGKWGLWWRRLSEAVRYGPNGAYDVSDALANTQLGDLNVVDPRFTLESIATRVEDFVPVLRSAP